MMISRRAVRKGLLLVSLAAAASSLPNALLAAGDSASRLKLAPFKDALFAYPQPSAVSKDGAFLDVPYSEARDIDQRDEIPERRVHGDYVELIPGRQMAEEVLQTPQGPIPWMRVGSPETARVVVLFVHGRNGDRRLGMNDWTFGGNFNRLKNLLIRSSGAYVTFDGGMLAQPDADRAAALLRHIRALNTSAKIVLTCGSMGGELCWNVLARKDVASSVAGVVLLGANSDEARFRRMRAAAGRAVPLMIAQGTRDKVYAVERQRSLFDAIRRQEPSYPIRMVVFDDGNHGTPIRMIDWRDTLNWILRR